ncbi:MAG TPA: SpoIIE family protein phosphatase [bacterium]
MGLIAGNLVTKSDSASKHATFIISQANGQIVHVSEEAGELLKASSEEIIGLDIRDIFPVALPPRLATVPKVRRNMWEDGTWICNTKIPGIYGVRELELTWRAVPMGWINYWYLTVKESGKVVQDSLLSEYLDKTIDPKNPIFVLHDHERDDAESWQMMSFHRRSGRKGGDILLIDEPGPGYILYFLGDVAGHNRSALVVRLMLATYLKVYREEFSLENPGDFPGMLLTRINKAIAMDENNDCLLTASAIILEKNGARAWYASAGHQPAFHVNSEGERTTLTTPDIPLGIVEHQLYKSFELSCNPGDRILCYTDGLINSGPNQTHKAGLKALLSTLETNRSKSLEVLTGEIQNIWMNAENTSVSEEDVTFTVITQKATILSVPEPVSKAIN